MPDPKPPSKSAGKRKPGEKIPAAQRVLLQEECLRLSLEGNSLTGIATLKHLNRHTVRVLIDERLTEWQRENKERTDTVIFEYIARYNLLSATAHRWLNRLEILTIVEQGEEILTRQDLGEHGRRLTNSSRFLSVMADAPRAVAALLMTALSATTAAAKLELPKLSKGKRDGEAELARFLEIISMPFAEARIEEVDPEVLKIFESE